MNTYTAKLFCGKKTVETKNGDDAEKLFIWMLGQASGPVDVDGIHGEVIENKTGKIVRQFKKAPPE